MVVIKVYNMEERYSIITKNAPIYRKARKKEKNANPEQAKGTITYG